MRNAMEEEQYMERFSMDGDFVDGEWIDGEFYYRSRKKKRGQTKEEALYGYQSSGSDSDGGGGGRRKKRRGGVIIEDKFSKPVNFVPGSVQNVGTTNSDDAETPGLGSRAENDAVEDQNGEFSDQGSQPSEFGGLGSGGGTGSQNEYGGIGTQNDYGGIGTQNEYGGLGSQNEYGGLGSQNEYGGLGSQNEYGGLGSRSGIGAENGLGGGLGSRAGIGASRSGIGAQNGFGGGLGLRAGIGASEAEDDEGELRLTDPLGRKIQETAQQKKQNQKKKADIVWEKHSSGFGSKMLQKMGWGGAGRGLGKDGQGIVDPILTKLRPKNMGMGFNDFQESTVHPAPEETEENRHKPKVSEKLWLKKNRNKAKEYVSAGELLARQEEKGGRTVNKVLDMTGPQVRVVTDMKNLNIEQTAVEDNTPMPELQHNLRLLVDLVASDIQHFDSKRRHDEQTMVILKKDRDRLQKELESQVKRLEVMNSIMMTINAVKTEVAARRLTLDGLATAIGKLKSDYPDEYKLWNLSALALSFVLPLVAPQFQGWQPFLQPSRGLDTLILWKEIFQEEDEAIFFEVDTSPYTRLVMETVMPHIRRAVVNWEARDPEPLLRFLDVWDKILPPSVLQNVLDHLVMPKLNAQVEAWNPLKDTVPVHAWVHPWLPLLGSRMEPLCGMIRVKLDSVLQAWDPSDASAFLMLSPWHSVFDAASWEHLMVRNIIPKLKYALDILVINPAQQQLEPFNWVTSWASVMPVHHMIRMLEERFFPKWHEALYHWLQNNPNFDEVSQWYEGWKSVLPQELLASDRIRWHLSGAIEMMNQAVEGVPVVLRTTEQWQQQQHQQQQQFEGLSKVFANSAADSEAEMSLKEVVETFAQENDVQFRPKVGRMHEGLQVYGFGSVSISVDNHKQVILAQSGEKWTSVSLEQLLDIHHAKKGGKWSS